MKGLAMHLSTHRWMCALALVGIFVSAVLPPITTQARAQTPSTSRPVPQTSKLFQVPQNCSK